MSIIIEIQSHEIENRSFTSKLGKPLSFREQTGWMHKPGQPYPEKVTVQLQDNQPPYNPGNYDIDPRSYYVDRFGNIAIRLHLLPRPAEQQKPAVPERKSA